MAPASPRLRILSVGGNPVSAFLSWRLQATNTSDVTLVWKSGFDSVAQYGISFRSKVFGNERFKPHAVVRTPEDASHQSRAPFDYVLLCVKALPDVYDLAAVIESVVSPQHTCILINTTHTLGIETYLEQRFPTNVVLSLVSGAEIAQLGPAEFEHKGSTDIWVGSANKNPSIPVQIQTDMAEALAITLSSGQVDCKVSSNIRQYQYERMIGNIAFHPASVLFETPNHAELLEKVGVRELVSGVMDELLEVAAAQGCNFTAEFKTKTLEAMVQPQDSNSIMYQDFQGKRPMEVETYLGSPMKLAQEVNIRTPRIETLYALLHHINIVNQQRPAAPATSPVAGPPPPRLSSAPMPRGPPVTNGQMNGMPPAGARRNGSRAPSMTGPPPPGFRRGPPPTNGYGPRNGYAPNGGPPMNRRPSLEGNDLEEFSHLMLYDQMEPEQGGEVYGNGAMAQSGTDIALRERELALRQKEIALREREFQMQSRGGGRGRRPPPPRGGPSFDDEDEDDGDYFDPMEARAPGPPIDADNFDMMSVTSRRTRKAPSAQQLRMNPEMQMQGGQGRGYGPRPGLNKNRSSARLMADVPGMHDSIMNNALMGYSSDRYGGVDRQALGHESRTNSLTAARLDELQGGNGAGYAAYPSMAPPIQRRTSQSPGNPLSPGPRNGGRPSPPNGYGSYTNGMQPNGRPSPPGMRQPVPRHAPGHGNAVAPQQVEQQIGVSNLYPPQAHKSGPQVRSLTGSASASAESGDSGASAHVDSEPSAASSQSSLGHRANGVPGFGPRPPIGVR